MQVIKNSFIYLTASILNKAIPLLLLPVFTQYLSPSEFGILSIFQISMSFFVALIGMAIQTNISKNYHIYDNEKLAVLMGNIFIILTLNAILITALTFLMTFSFDSIFSVPANWFRVLPIFSFLMMINTVNLTLLRNEGKAKEFGIFEISCTLTNMSIALIMLLGMEKGWESQAIGIAVSLFAFSSISYYQIKRRGLLCFTIESKEIKKILMISIPLIPHALGALIIALSDRLFIEAMIGIDVVGIYSVGYMFGMVIALFTDAFMKAWNPWFFKSISEANESTKKRIVLYTYAYICAIFSLVFFVSIITKFALPIVVDERYLAAETFVVWVAFGYFIQGIYKIFMPYLVHLNKTYFLAVSTSFAALSNLLLNYFFIKSFGAIGAAYSTIVSFSLSALLVFWFQNKFIKMPWLASAR